MDSPSSKVLTSLLLAAIAVFAPIKGVLLATLVLVAGDLATGLWAAVKKRQPITSSGLRKTAAKALVYELAIVLGFVAEKYLLPELPVTKLLGALIAATELKSIDENFKRILGRSLFGDIIARLAPPSKIDDSSKSS